MNYLHLDLAGKTKENCRLVVIRYIQLDRTRTINVCVCVCADIVYYDCLINDVKVLAKYLCVDNMKYNIVFADYGPNYMGVCPGPPFGYTIMHATHRLLVIASEFLAGQRMSQFSLTAYIRRKIQSKAVILEPLNMPIILVGIGNLVPLW